MDDEKVNGAQLPVPFRLGRATLAAPPAGWPPDVAPNQIIASSHINRIRSTVYEWPGDVDGMHHKLKNVTLENVTGVMVDPTTTVGDLIARGQSGTTRLPAGTAGQALTADATQPLGLRWVTLSYPVNSVFGRTGAVIAAAGDYTAGMVTNAVDQTQTYNNPSWIGSVPWSKITAPPATFPPQAHQHDAADVASGRLNTARLGTGIADATVYLRGDGQWMPLNIPASPVASVFGRTGAVAAQTGDYTAAQVVGAVADPTIALGDILVRGPAGIVRLPAGANGTVLQVDTAQPSSLRWGLQSGGPGIPTALNNGDIMQWVNGAWAILPVGVVGQVLLVNSGGGGLRWGAGGGGSQTPWLTDIDADNHALNNVSTIVSNGPIRSATGGFIFPDGSTMTKAASQTPWLQDIDAAGYALGNVKTLHVRKGGASGYVQPATGSALFEGDDTNHVAIAAPAAKTAGLNLARGADLQGQLLTVPNEGVQLIAVGAQPIEFSTGSAKRMRIAADGKVGVGNLNPQYALDVIGDMNYTGTLRLNGVPVSFGGSQTPWTSDINAAGFSLNNAGALKGQQLVLNGAPGVTHSTVKYQTAGVTRWEVGNKIDDNSFAVNRYNASGVYVDAPISLDPATGLTSIRNGLSVTSQLSLYGTSSPVVHPIIGYYINGVKRWQAAVDAGTAEYKISRWNTSGVLVDIPLSIEPGAGDAYFGGNVYVANSGGTAGTTFRMDGHVNKFHMVAQGTGGRLAFMTGDVIRMEIADNGLIGIGTSTPLAHVHISNTNLEPPVLGQQKGSIYFTYADNVWGTQIGHLNSGDTWIQAQRSDGVGTTYQLLLNPLGGAVCINKFGPPGYTLDVNGSVGVTGGFYGNLNGNAASASSVAWGGVTGKPGLVIAGQNNVGRFDIAGQSIDYNGAAIQIREAWFQNQGGNVTGADGNYWPHISFHWANNVAVNVGMNYNGEFQVLNYLSTGPADFRCNAVNAALIRALTMESVGGGSPGYIIGEGTGAGQFIRMQWMTGTKWLEFADGTRGNRFAIQATTGFIVMALPTSSAGMGSGGLWRDPQGYVRIV